MKRILVIRGGAIGDFILILPGLRLLREAYPRARIEILGYAHIAALADGRFYADAVRSIEYGALSRFFARGAELPEELAVYFADFDLVISYLFDPDRIFETNIRRCGVENFIRASPKVDGSEHAAIQLARPFRELDLKISDARATLFPTTEDRRVADHYLPSTTKPIIAIHPGSGSESKNWPIENWVELATALTARHRWTFFVVVLGEADTEALGHLQHGLAGLSASYVVNQPLTHVAGILSRCHHFVGHDSGISHIAAAVGTNCTLLFGPTDPAIWAPAGGHVKVLRAPDKAMQNIAVSDVEHELRNILD
jgi:heptosyltransferase-2